MKNQNLIVRPKTENDKIEIEKLVEKEMYYCEYKEESNEFYFPEQNLDALENELNLLFNRNKISASFSS